MPSRAAHSIDWPADMRQLLVDGEVRAERSKAARKDQILVNGIEAQSRVVQAGGPVWSSILSWGIKNGRLSSKDVDILQVATGIPGRLPSERQSQHLITLVKRLETEGCTLGSDIIKSL